MERWWTGPDWGKLGSGQDDEVYRREFLKLVLALGGLTWAERDSIAAEVARSCGTGRALVTELDRIATQLAARWDDGRPGELRRQLLGLYAVVAQLAESARPPLRSDLQQLAARTAALLGLVNGITGRDDRAGMYLAMADAWAMEAGDEHLRAVALSWIADLDSAVQRGHGGPSDTAVRLGLHQAEARLAGAPPAVAAFVLLRVAEELAAGGELDEAQRYLDHADAAWSARAGRQDGIYGIAWSDSLHMAFRANTAVLSRRPDVAVPILMGVLKTASGSNWIAAAADLAAAFAMRGEVDAAAELLTSAWGEAQTAGLATRARRIRGIRHRELAAYGDVPAVRRLDEALAGG